MKDFGIQSSYHDQAMELAEEALIKKTKGAVTNQLEIQNIYTRAAELEMKALIESSKCNKREIDWEEVALARSAMALYLDSRDLNMAQEIAKFYDLEWELDSQPYRT